MTYERPFYYSYQGQPNQAYFPPSHYQYPYQYQQPNNPTMESPPPVSTPYEYFAKPQQPYQWEDYYSVPYQAGPPPNSWGQAPPSGFANYFQDKNGQVDLDKMFSTVGQMANTVQQVSPIFKGIGSFIKGMK